MQTAKYLCSVPSWNFFGFGFWPLGPVLSLAIRLRDSAGGYTFGIFVVVVFLLP